MHDLPLLRWNGLRHLSPVDIGVTFSAYPFNDYNINKTLSRQANQTARLLYLENHALRLCQSVAYLFHLSVLYSYILSSELYHFYLKRDPSPKYCSISLFYTAFKMTNFASSEILSQPHYLPVRQRVEYKFGTVVYLCLHDAALSNRYELCIPVNSNPNRRHRRLATHELTVPTTCASIRTRQL